ncbi:MAG: sulfurtransferase [Desulfobacteraceae bacterium]|nr:sulfurtransferase [Desulfobacteraceae bacterium]MCF8095539.1 sulfurtransferase [Desulfobacteraceae bacterium]
MKNRLIRYSVIALVLFLGILWSFGSAEQRETGYPNANLITNAQWLKNHLNEKDLVVVDVRTDKYYHGSVIPGAVRMPWSQFQFNDVAADLASTFVGVREAQDILGRHGITRDDTVVLYDSVERDGGATASYVFWVLDVLGHEKKMILDRGIDAWRDAGYDLATEPRKPEPLLYQAPAEAINAKRLIDGTFVYKKLGDFYYQIVDARSRAEYLGEKGTTGLDGSPLKLGHIPTAVNINYESAWTNPETKAMKSYSALQELYRGIDPSRGVIVYCNSGRRSAFSYYVLRLMGFEDVFTYEGSWNEWGNPDKFFPVETRENRLAGGTLPGTSSRTSSSQQMIQKGEPGKPSSGEPSGGYVSCGG